MSEASQQNIGPWVKGLSDEEIRSIREHPSLEVRLFISGLNGAAASAANMGEELRQAYAELNNEYTTLRLEVAELRLRQAELMVDIARLRELDALVKRLSGGSAESK